MSKSYNDQYRCHCLLIAIACYAVVLIVVGSYCCHGVMWLSDNVGGAVEIERAEMDAAVADYQEMARRFPYKSKDQEK